MLQLAPCSVFVRRPYPLLRSQVHFPPSKTAKELLLAIAPCILENQKSNYPERRVLFWKVGKFPRSRCSENAEYAVWEMVLGFLGMHPERLLLLPLLLHLRSGVPSSTERRCSYQRLCAAAAAAASGTGSTTRP